MYNENIHKKDKKYDWRAVKKVFCEEMKKLRKDNDLSQERFSEKIGVNLNTYKTWENEYNDSIPDVKTINKVIKKIKENFEKEYTFSELLDEKPPENTNVNYIKEHTGLNEDIVNKLLCKNQMYTKIINELVTNENFIGILYAYLFTPPSNDCLNINSKGKIKVNDFGTSGINIQGEKLVDTLLPRIQYELINIREKIYPRELTSAELRAKEKSLKRERDEIKKIIKAKEEVEFENKKFN